MSTGNEYAYEDLQIVVEGLSIPLTGVSGIELGVTRDHKNLMGRGAEPVAMGRGKKEYKPIKVTLLQSEFERMYDGMPVGKNLVDRKPFTITASFAPEGAPVVSYIAKGCRVTDEGIKIGADDPAAEITFEVLPLSVRRTR